DLPEPDGPHKTIRSPGCTLRLMSLSTWNWPYHLFTPCSRIIGSALGCLLTSLIIHSSRGAGSGSGELEPGKAKTFGGAKCTVVHEHRESVFNAAWPTRSKY